jgi:hypothetical protein
MTKVSLKTLFTLNYSIVVGVVGIYFLNNYFLKQNFNSVILDNHLNDFLFMLLLNSVCFIILKTMYSGKKPWFRIFLLNYIITCILFELIFPNFVQKITGDIFDCIAYFCGLVVYLTLFKIYDTNNILHFR